MWEGHRPKLLGICCKLKCFIL
uniref:Uncharacterized protein n=1 Tax=Rhizophora mucronata TaxID=61149 RepID=A0A2P2J367_RHIMU